MTMALSSIRLPHFWDNSYIFFIVYDHCDIFDEKYNQDTANYIDSPSSAASVAQ